MKTELIKPDFYGAICVGKDCAVVVNNKPHNGGYVACQPKLLSNCEFDDLVIEECTGLRDKNNVEIYEGDIIKFEIDGEEFTAEVRYSLGKFHTVRPDEDDEDGKGFELIYDLDFVVTRCKGEVVSHGV